MSDVAAAEVTEEAPTETETVTESPAVESVATTATDPGESQSNVIWPEDWQMRLSGGDEKIAERLGRYAEPGLVGKALIEAQDKIRSGAVKQPLADDATPEQIAEWRQENGVPAEVEEYFAELPDGLVIGTEDKAGMDVLAKEMHDANAPKGMAHAAIRAYYKHIESVQAERAELDAQAKKDTDDALHELYGNEFRRNINDLNSWLDGGGEEVKAKIFSSRTADGTPLGSDPVFLQWMIGQMREIDPLVTVVGAGAGDPSAALDDEIAGIEKKMTEDFKGYSADKGMQARYQTLLEARDKRK